ncbi:MAG: 30S ribosomal protein S21 [bacterium]
MSEVKRKKNETFESLLRRFNKRIQQSGKLYQARNSRFKQPEKSRGEQKKSALAREKFRKEKEYQRKVGLLKDEVPTNRKFR